MKAMTPYSPPRLGISAQPTSLQQWISGALGDQRLTHLYLGPPSAIRLPCRTKRCDTGRVSQLENATPQVCRKITLRHVDHVAGAGCDTPCISHKWFATLLLCRMRHTQCLMGHRKQPKPVQRVPLMAQSVPKLALLLLVIFRHITQ